MYWEKAEAKSSSFPGIGPKAPETFSGGTDRRQLARSASWLVPKLLKWFPCLCTWPLGGGQGLWLYRRLWREGGGISMPLKGWQGGTVVPSRVESGTSGWGCP